MASGSYCHVVPSVSLAGAALGPVPIPRILRSCLAWSQHLGVRGSPRRRLGPWSLTRWRCQEYRRCGARPRRATRPQLQL